MKEIRLTSVQSVPLGIGFKLEELEKDEETESWPFRELVGGLMWLAILIRPDISNAVRSVERYCSTPKAIHWKAALGILAYISVFSGFFITNQRGILVGISLEVFANANNDSKATDTRSVFGGAVMCGGACLCWFFRPQKYVTLSSSEAEYVALGDTVKELLFSRQGVAFHATR